MFGKRQDKFDGSVWDPKSTEYENHESATRIKGCFHD